MKRPIFALAALALLIGACSSGDPESSPTPAPTEALSSGPVITDLGEWSVLADPQRVAAGEITFEVANGGREEHELVIVEANGLEPGELPTLADGSVDEEQLEILGDTDEIAAGDEEDLALELEAGDYILFCNLVHEPEGEDHAEHSETEVHYKLGMRTGLSVE